MPLGSRGLGERNQRTRRAPRMAGPHRRRPSEGHSRAGRELQRCDPKDGDGRIRVV